MKLDICAPVIASHHYYAFPLAIIGSQAKLQPWLYSEFIQWNTYRNREDERMHMRIYNNKNEMFLYEPLDGTVFMPGQFADGDHIVSTYESFLMNYQYIYDFVDSYYISSDPRNYHCMHDLLIYGFNDDRRVLFAFAYHGDRLVQLEIPYSEYEAAYNSDYQKERFHCTTLYRIKNAVFHTNIARIGNHLLDYLGGINTYNRESPLSVDLYKPKFGVDVYDELKYNLQYMRDWNLEIDIPDMCCVYDHKRFMHERVIYLDKCTEIKCPNVLKNKFAELETAGKIMLMLVMKLNRKGLSCETDYNNLVRRFDMMKDLEKATFSKYYEYNRSVFENS